MSRQSQQGATIIRVEPVIVENDNRPLLPRKKRQRNRRREDRGLPDRAVLEALYRAYRDKADRLWPELVGTELLPVLTDEVVANAVDQYQRKHRDGRIDTEDLEGRLAVHGVKQGGMFYGRYSCEQSQTTSVEDQLSLSLDRAHEEGYFIPFELVFADFALSGLTDDRPGFDGVRDAIKKSGPSIARVYIAEFHRASRNYRDWENLYYLVKRSRKVLKSATGDFDSSRLDALAVLARGSATNVEEKTRRVAVVRRGRKGAEIRGTSTGHPPIGYTRRQAFDPKSNTLRERRNGCPITEWVIDPVTKPVVELTFELFVVRRWSRRRIAKHFVKLRVNDSTSWTAGTIKDILRNTTYVGVLFRDRFTRVRNPETGKLDEIENPRSEWTIIFMPHLRLIPPAVFRQARLRLAEMARKSPLTGKKWTKMERNPRTAWEGLFYCECCDWNPITRSRSGPNPQYASVRGQNGANGCRLPSSKSVDLVEQTLSEWLKANLLCDETAEVVGGLANERLEEAARRQLPDPEVVRKRRAKRQQSIQNLVDAFKEATSRSVRARLNQELEEEQRLLVEDNKELEGILVKQKTDVVRLDLEAARRAFADLRQLFSEDVPRAAHMLRELLGPIRIRQELIEGSKEKYRWIATFTPRWRNTVAKLVPTHALAGVNQIVGDLGRPVAVVIEKVPLYQKLAPQIVDLYAKPMTKTDIAKHLGLKSVMVVTDALNFHYRGTVRPPRSQRPKREAKPSAKKGSYKEIVDEVLRLRHVKEKSFQAIAKQLGVTRGVVDRAYRAGRKAAQEAGAIVPAPLKRAAQLPKATLDTIRALADSELTTAEIAQKANCSHQTAARYRREFRTRAA